MKKNLVSAMLMISLLGACSSVPMVTDRDVLVSENRGELMTLYTNMQAELKTAKPGSDLAENRTAYLVVVGKKIAEDKERIILNDLGRQVESHDIATLQTALDQASKIEQYNKGVYEGLRMQLEQGINQKKTVIDEKENEFSQLSDGDAIRKVELLNEIAAISGGQEAQQVAVRRTAYLESLSRSAESAMDNKRNEDAEILINNLEKIEPGYPGIADMRHRLIAAEYEQQFWDALGKGETDTAYDTFHQLTQIPNYVANHPDVIPIAEDIAQFFIAEGDKHAGTGSLAAAYEAYSRARYIRKVMGKGDLYSPGELKFIEGIDKRFQRYMSESVTVAAFGHLSILEELDPKHASVTKYSQKINSVMLADATIKIIPSAFTETESKRSLGLGIVSKINKQLMDAMPTRVQVIELNKAASNYSSEQVAKMPNSGSYYFLSGEILESNVGVNKKPASVTRRVLTSYKKEANPEYVAWTQLKKREQKETPKPQETIDVPVEEDVTVKKVIVDKQGVFSITYRLADALTASVVFSDALSKKESHTGEQVEGIELGLFKQESVVAELPSDADILEKLSGEISTEAAGKIATQVETLETAYITRADAAVVSEDFNAAAANYGYSHALLQARGKVDASVLGKLRKFAIRWK